ncbi:HIRAN domain-containing protein [Selenomonas ruminantium]|uniref:HIRAN domain-containing protein n=1 Tax=Selenomonas ruminantium TaxID=971 RepID=UPI0026EB93F5|nr:HIRAN domain-containing protein [Selenomonas ruminantium]
MDEFYSKIAGVTFDNRQYYISNLSVGDHLIAIREYNNAYDANAIALYDSEKNQLGYIRKEVAAQLAPRIDGGEEIFVYVDSVTGGNDYNFGVNIKILIGKIKSKIKNGEIPPSYLNMLYEGSYMNFLKEIGMYDEVKIGNMSPRMIASSIAVQSGKYNVAIQVLGNEINHKTCSVKAMNYMYIGDFETALHLASMGSEGKIYGVDKKICDDLLKFIEVLGVHDYLEELSESELTLEDYSYKRTSEDEWENYTEIYQFEEFKNSYQGNERGFFDELTRLINSCSKEDRKLGNAYLAEVALACNELKDAFRYYVEAAKIAQNNPVYYGYASNMLFKLISREKIESVSMCVYASILARRAINLDFSNPRWHHYQALCLELMGAFLYKKNPEEPMAKKWLEGSRDEFNLALSLIKDYQHTFRNAVLKCISQHEMIMEHFFGRN